MLVTAIPVINLHQATTFYTRVLGMTVVTSAPRWAELRFGDHGGSIILHAAPGFIRGSGIALGFTVEDIEMARADLILKGAQLDGPLIVQDGVTMLYFFDPDGNPLYLRQLTPRDAGS